MLNSLRRASHIVIIVVIMIQCVPEMSDIQDKDQIQALFPDGSNPTFGVPIGIRCLEGV